MTTTMLQVRDIDAAVVEVLKRRAEEQDMSLSAFIRQLLAQEAAMPSPQELAARIASRQPISVSSDDVRELLEEGRRW